MIVCHNDADGVTSAVLFLYAMGLGPDDVKVRVAEYFGQVNPNDRFCFDMVPEDPNWDGQCFDHHPQHPPETERKYTLIWDNVPTGVIVYKQYKDDIPDEQKWKVAIAAVGDGQPEVIPPEIFDMFPELLDEILWVREGKVSFTLPRYKLISSGINSLMRVGNYEYALNLLYHAKRPDDLIFNEEAEKARNTIANECYKIAKNSKFVKLGNNIVYLEFESNLDVTGRIASEWQDKLGYTVVAYNITKGKLSIRGDLAMWVGQKLRAAGVNVGGHPGFMGGELEPGVSLIDKLRSVLR